MAFYRVYNNIYYNTENFGLFTVGKDYSLSLIKTWQGKVGQAVLEKMFAKQEGAEVDLSILNTGSDVDSLRKQVKRIEQALNMLIGKTVDPNGCSAKSEYVLFKNSKSSTKKVLCRINDDKSRAVSSLELERSVLSQSYDYDTIQYINEKVYVYPNALFYMEVIKDFADSNSKNYNAVLWYLFQKYQHQPLIPYELGKLLVEAESKFHEESELSRKFTNFHPNLTIKALKNCESLLENFERGPNKTNPFLVEYCIYRRGFIKYELSLLKLKTNKAEAAKLTNEALEFFDQLLDMNKDISSDNAAGFGFTAWMDNLKVLSYQRLASIEEKTEKKKDYLNKALGYASSAVLNLTNLEKASASEKHYITHSIYKRNKAACIEQLMRLETPSFYVNKDQFKECFNLYKESLQDIKNVETPLIQSFYVLLSLLSKRIESCFYDADPEKFSYLSSDKKQLKQTFKRWESSSNPALQREIHSLIQDYNRFLQEMNASFKNEENCRRFNVFCVKYQILEECFINHNTAIKKPLLEEFKERLLYYKYSDQNVAESNEYKHLLAFYDSVIEYFS